MRKKRSILQLIFVASCVFIHVPDVDAQNGNTLFSALTEKQTGVYFLNNITEDDSLNVMRYEYLYNGAGVGIADFNNDGWNDIFFSGNTTANKLFLNRKDFRFDDITREAGVKGNGTWSTGVSVADVNGDGLMDIYVCHSGKYADPALLKNELFINQGIQNGIPVFKEMAATFGLDAPGTQSTQAAFFDYDKDGDLDMFLLNHSNHTYNPFLNTRKIRSTPNFSFGNRLFRNDRDKDGQMHFTDVTLQAGIINNALNFGLSVTISDLNKDGWPDIYTTSDYTERDCYYVNNRNGTFTESLSKSFEHISKFAMGADIADYNNDGRPDVFTLDMLPEDNHRQKLLKGPDEYDKYHLLLDSGYYKQFMRNMLQLNQGTDDKGNLRFSEIGQLAGISNTDWSWSGLLADFDNDGWKDLFVSNGYLRDFTDMDFLKYTVADAKAAALKEGTTNFETYDLVKKMPANKLTNYFFRNNHDLTFSNSTKPWGIDRATVSNAAAYADLDNDGDLDLVVCNNNEPAILYKNNQQVQKKTHYLKIRFEGDSLNRFGYGVKVLLQTSDSMLQYQELYPVRGYQSTVAPEMLFGFGLDQVVTSIKITWPDGKQSIFEKPDADTTLYVKQSAAHSQRTQEIPVKNSVAFEDISAGSGISFIHHENDFIDFKDEVLLPYQLSRFGPALAKADVNGDGLEDVFIGGAINQPGMLYIQNATGTFSSADSQPWLADAVCEKVNALFFDADGDGDMDLYVVSGGNEYGDGSPEYADQLYRNDGKGNFEKQTDALPAMLSSKQAIAAGDIDNDGDLDLFVGGKCIPGAFPLPARSYVLRNDSKDGLIKFTDITEAQFPFLKAPGIVNIAAWIDLNNDHYPELLIGGDWMNMQLFNNNKGSLTDIADAAGLKNMSGMWSAIKLADIDGDGDLDILLGNCGYNNQFKASPQQPVTLTVSDFDDNGSLDAIMSYYIMGKSYPMASRDELLDQIVPLKKKFVKYKDYADASLEQIFPADKLKDAKRFYCDQFASGVLYNQGKGKFLFTPFPIEAQFSKVYGIIADDFDGDGIKDILLSGNFYPYRVQLGPADAGLGLLLKGDGKTFKPIDPAISRCYIDGDVRGMEVLKTASGRNIVVVKNDAAVQVLKCTP